MTSSPFLQAGLDRNEQVTAVTEEENAIWHLTFRCEYSTNARYCRPVLLFGAGRKRQHSNLVQFELRID